MKRVLPISSIRFVLAVWVVLGHFGIPILRQHNQVDILWAFRVFVNNAFNGPAAVVVFFVISGFCIHFPNRKKLEVHSWRLYLARRYLRTLIPMLGALAIAMPLKMPFGLFTDSILWSLLCEEIYYLLYPGLLLLRDRMGWRYLMTLAWALAFVVVLTNPRALSYAAYGPGLNWMLGLPCWLIGCRLAERLDSFSRIPVSTRQIWLWRGGTWMLSSTLCAMRFHTPIGYPWTLNLFAVIATLWIEREIRYYHAGRPQLFESLGEASYSIYLTHLQCGPLLQSLPIAAGMGLGATWFSSMALCGGVSTLFYWVVERPSHRLARRFTRHAMWLKMAQPLAAVSEA
jgi:peptidoglycan/LPS O-acetylase OafA/YrhL